MPRTKPPKKPHLFNDKLKEKIEDYIENCPNQVHSMSGLAVYLGLSRAVLYHWADKEDNKYMQDVIELVARLQEIKLIDKGLIGDFNPAIAKMLLSRHGYADKVENDITSGGQQLNTWTVQPVTTKPDE